MTPAERIGPVSSPVAARQFRQSVQRYVPVDDASQGAHNKGVVEDTLKRRSLAENCQDTGTELQCGPYIAIETQD